MTLAIGLTVAGSLFHDSDELLVFGPCSVLSSMAVMGLVGGLARGVPGAA